jgi:hypothetical protein
MAKRKAGLTIDRADRSIRMLACDVGGRVRAARMVTGILALGMFAAGCETDSDWLAANGGLPDLVPSQFGPIAPCGGRNDWHWLKLDSAPANAEVYLRHARVVDEAFLRYAPGSAEQGEARNDDTWYTRKPGEVLLCRESEGGPSGGYSAFWRFREKDGQVIVAESYAWNYVIVN